MSRPLTKHDQLVGALVLGMAVWMGVLGTPVFDQMKKDWYSTDRQRQALRRQVGPLAPIGFAAVWVNNTLRKPVADLFTPLQGPLGIGQSWYLYLDGPSKTVRANIYVDGELVGRSSDPEHPWLQNKTDYRRMRPFLGAMCKPKKTKYWRGTFGWVVREVRSEFPDVERVELHCTVERLPELDGTRNPEEVRWVYFSDGPDFKPEREEGPALSTDDEDDLEEADEGDDQ